LKQAINNRPKISVMDYTVVNVLKVTGNLNTIQSKTNTK